MRNPIERLGLPHAWTVGLDWIVTIVGAVAIVLAIKAWVVNPYRIPSSSMEPTLHCARPGTGCVARFSDRVLANRFIYHLTDPSRGDVVVFETPPKARPQCGAGGTFVKRIIGLPGETWSMQNGFVFINGKKLDEPYIKPGRRDRESYPPQISLSLEGELPTPCHELRAEIAPPDAENKIQIAVYSVVDRNEACAQVLGPVEESIDLGTFPPGHYSVWVNGELAGEFDS